MNCKGVEEGVLQNHRPTDRTSTDKCSTDNRPTDPPKLAKLVKLSAEILSIPHSIAISNTEYFQIMSTLPQLFHLTKVNQTKLKFPILGQ